MSTSPKHSYPRSLLRQFAGNDRGNIAVLFSIAVLPIITFVGAAVDYTRVSTARTTMQSALDSAALMVSKDLSSGAIKTTDINAQAQAYFKALYTNKEAYGVNVVATYTAKDSQGKSTIAVTGSGSINTEFMKVAGYPKLDFSTASTTTWGGTRMRVALALDVTGSMLDDNKLVEMKKAAKKLIDTLKSSATTAEDVYISIIPFNQMVNVEKSNKDAAWLDWDTDYGSCSRSQYKLKSDCLAAGRRWTASGVNNWKGCVQDRTQPYDTTKDVPDDNTPATLFIAKNYSTCSSAILPMTSAFSSKEKDDSDDDNTLKGKINNLIALGGTNQPIGMHWAWMMLQPNVPFVTPAKDEKYKYTDAIILLSDGLNTIDRWPSYGNGQVQYGGQIDARQKLLCDNIDRKNLATNKPDTIIYTIQVNTDNDPESAILKYCANPPDSNENRFFPTSTASGIAEAFNAIGASLSALRVAQ